MCRCLKVLLLSLVLLSNRASCLTPTTRSRNKALGNGSDARPARRVLQNVRQKLQDDYRRVEQKETDLYVRQENFGIVHLSIPGLLETPEQAKALNDAADAGYGNLHLYLKAMQKQPDRLYVRGVSVFESIRDPMNKGFAHYHVPQGMWMHLPDISLKAVTHNLTTVLTVTKGVGRDRPFDLQGSVVADSAYYLNIGSWLRTHVYSPIPMPYIAPARSHNTSPQVIVVMAPFFKITPSLAARLLLEHMSYHAPFGFSRHMLYVRQDYMPGLTSHQGIVSAIDAQKLWLMLWQPIAEYRRQMLSHPDQAVTYNHAMLAFTGTNSYLALIDIDEYLMTPSPATFSQLWQDCMQHALLACISFVDIYCGSDVCGASGELSVWTDPAITQPLQYYNLQGKQFSHVHCKSILQPDYVFGYFVHDGELFPDEDGHKREKYDVDPSCARWGHLRNLFRSRKQHESKALGTSWQWVLQQGNST